MIMSSTVDPLLVRDEFHNIIEIPERFPSIDSKCMPGVPCVLNVTAITMNVYSFLDKLDNGLEPVAASEQRTKMNSRQSILQAYTNQKYDFNWALKSAPLGTVKRYLTKGKILKIGADIGPVNNGFLWVNSHLVFNFNLSFLYFGFILFNSKILIFVFNKRIEIRAKSRSEHEKAICGSGLTNTKNTDRL